MNEYIKSSKATQNTNASILAGYKDEVIEVDSKPPVQKKPKVDFKEDKKSFTDVHEIASTKDVLKAVQVFSESDGHKFENCTFNINVSGDQK